MNFIAYRYFNEVTKTRSIRRAADRLHVAPSAVSRQIALLEHQLGVALLERSSTGIQLTPAGTILERYTRTMFRDLERVHDSIKSLTGLRQGEVKIWVIEGLILDVLPKAIASFNEAFPNIRFSVHAESSDRTIEGLIKDEVDIGVVYNPKPRPTIEIMAQYCEPVMCLMAKDHPLAGRSSLSLAEICSQRLALPIPSFGLRQLFDAAVARQGLNPNVIISSNNLQLTRNLAVSSQALSIGPALAASGEIQRGSLVAVPIEDEDFALAAACICIHRDRRLSDAAHAFLKSLCRDFTQLGGSVAA